VEGPLERVLAVLGDAGAVGGSVLEEVGADERVDGGSLQG
jgi:hypothetical protein